MGNKRIRDIEGYEAFKAECSFFKCDEEYPGWVGTEKYGIITGLSKEELEEKYPQFTSIMSPYVLLDLEYGRIRAEAKRNEDKFEKRAKRNNSFFEMDEEAERFNAELSVPDFLTEMIEKQDEEAHHKEMTLICRAAMAKLTAKQQENLVNYFINGKTMQQIADENHCSKATIGVSISNAKVKFLKVYRNMLTNGTPNSMHYEGVESILNRIAASNKTDESNEDN